MALNLNNSTEDFFKDPSSMQTFISCGFVDYEFYLLKSEASAALSSPLFVSSGVTAI